MAKSYFDKFAGAYNFFMKLFGRAGNTAEIIRESSSINSNFNVLDVGGGTGLIADYLSSKVKQIVVLDPSKNMLAKIKNRKIKKIFGGAENIPFKDRTFDLVYCVDSLHHFSNGHRAQKWLKIINECISELLRVLKKGGILLIIDFDRSKFQGRIIQGFENDLMKWGSCFFTPEELKGIFEKHKAKCKVRYINNYCYIAEIRKK